MLTHAEFQKCGQMIYKAHFLILGLIYVRTQLLVLFAPTATKRFCSPDFSVEFFGLQFQVTEANGRCSYGVCNVGHYNETYKKQDVVDQCFNPAGQFNYDQLINQAKNQTYVLTKLFSTTEIPKSVFSVFLPGETLPTTKFLEAPAPVKPTVNTNTTCEVPTSSTTTATSTATPTSTYVGINQLYML